MIYAICEECISKNYLQYNNYQNCNGKPKKQVIFIAFGHHKDIYSRKRKIKLDKKSPPF